MGTMPSVAQGAPPLGVTGMAQDGRVELSWQAAAGATSYNVYRGTSPTAINTPVSLTGVPPPPLSAPVSFGDGTAANGTTYYYAVRAVVGGVESANSRVVRATPRPRSCSGGNPVVQENCFPGDSDWDVAIASTGVAGYATSQSVNRGQSIDLKVQSGAAVDIEIFRSGHYGGAGARLFSTLVDVPVSAQPGCTNDPAVGLYDCSAWTVTQTITTTTGWPSGVYLARVTRRDTGDDTHVLFVVRDDTRQAEVLFGLPFTTYQAYNDFGGKSLYESRSTGPNTVAGSPRAVKLSFDRPYNQQHDSSSTTGTPAPTTRRSPGSSARATTCPTSRCPTWSARRGACSITACSSRAPTTSTTRPPCAMRSSRPASAASTCSSRARTTSTGRSASSRVRCPGSRTACSSVTRARRAGRRTRAASPPAPGATRPARTGPRTRSPAASTWGRSTSTGSRCACPRPRAVTASGATRGSRTRPTGRSPNVGNDLVGWEWDARVNNGLEPAGVTTLAESPVDGRILLDAGRTYNENGTALVHATKYTWPSGSLVFDAGTNHWNWGLALNARGQGEPDRRIQQATTNVLADMGALPETPAANIVLDDPNAPPLVTQRSPATNATERGSRRHGARHLLARDGRLHDHVELLPARAARRQHGAGQRELRRRHVRRHAHALRGAQPQHDLHGPARPDASGRRTASRSAPRSAGASPRGRPTPRLRRCRSRRRRTARP